ncbi:MAG: DedA family protein [candidate division Zixibacteria bacterium]|nr:DedA family protein [candidate division Zixibacteria bacterium]
MENLITNFGYPALFLGSFLEGESFLIAAGFLAKRGYLDLNLIIIVAMAGAYLGDVTLYFLGRKKGRGIISKFPQIEIHYPKAKKLFDKYGMWAIFLTRYLYGLRFASAAFFGLMKMRVRNFLFLAFFSCLIWAVLIGNLGYVFGASLEVLIGQVKHYEKMIAVVIVVLGITIWLIRRFVFNRKITAKG